MLRQRNKPFLVLQKGQLKGDMAVVLSVTTGLFALAIMLHQNNRVLKELKQNVDSLSDLVDSISKLIKKLKELLNILK